VSKIWLGTSEKKAYGHPIKIIICQCKLSKQGKPHGKKPSFKNGNETHQKLLLQNQVGVMLDLMSGVIFLICIRGMWPSKLGTWSITWWKMIPCITIEIYS